MLKSVLVVALCIVVLIDCKPYENTLELSDEHHRTARAPQFQSAIRLGGQMANEGIKAATQGMNILSTAAQQAITAGTEIAANAAKTATLLI